MRSFFALQSVKARLAALGFLGALACHVALDEVFFLVDELLLTLELDVLTLNLRPLQLSILGEIAREPLELPLLKLQDFRGHPI